MNIRLLLAAAVLLLLFSCQENREQAPAQDKTGSLFTDLPVSRTGVSFDNYLKETETFNFFLWEAIYNGAGVAAVDYNGDDLPDLFFCGNNADDKLYLNQGGMSFKDVTAEAGITENGWSTGVTVGDVNQDGLPDLYVCRSGYEPDIEGRRNKLYVNQGNGKFKEQAKAYGLDHPGFSIQAVFFDKDNDGDLDMALGNQPPDGRLLKLPAFANQQGPDFTANRLYENTGNNTFIDVTQTSGFVELAHTLNVQASDLNDDGWTDLYFTSDYEKPDYLYINNKNGTFTAQTDAQLGHISNFSMGSDIADFDNDGLKDILTMDMALESHYRSKTNMNSMRPERFEMYIRRGWHKQYMSNMLQMNNGNNSFSEVAQFAGVAKTDWSWSCLFADFDNDGFKDIAVTNGILRDIRNNDFGNYVKDLNKKGVRQFTISQLTERLPSTPVKNYAYKNNGDLTFSKVTDDWGLGKPGFTQGMTYADLDNDGDLDLVMNNMNAPASIYRNNADGSKNYLRVKLEGTGKNDRALNAQVTIRQGEGLQKQELTLTRGYMSAVERVLHFGLGDAAAVDELVVDWPNGQQSVLQNVKGNQVLTVKQTEAGNKRNNASAEKALFIDRGNLAFKHTENNFDDLKREILLPHLQSVQGPFMTSTDVNKDGKTDLFIGGASGQPGQLLLQSANGAFTPAAQQPWAVEAPFEDVGSLFFDADGDGDSDLYVVSGGSEFTEGFGMLQDRLYFNDGAGNFKRNARALPLIFTNGQCVRAADIDGDGDQDLFVGGRGAAGKYPRPAQSSILLNDGSGKFTDATASIAPEIERVGMVSDALFSDYDGDKDLDLLIVGEWMSITIFENEDGKFSRTEPADLAQTGGWWWSITEGDFNADGLPDYLVGNMGKNHKYKAKPKQPFTVFGTDFDNNGTNDVVLASYNGDELLPVRGRECSSEQMPFVAEKFPTYDGFAKATVETIYDEKLNSAVRYEVHDFSTVLLLNKGGGNFEKKPLPVDIQTAPLRGAVVTDLNGDGHADFIGAGNLFDAEVETLRHDAGRGVIMIGDGTGNFKSLKPVQSGFFAGGDARDVILINDKFVIVSLNDARPRVFEVK